MSRHLASVLRLLLVLAIPVLAHAEAAAGTSAPTTEPYGPEPRVAMNDGVPVRVEPGFVHNELYFLSKGQEVVVDGKQGKWFHVRPQGWVYEDHLLAREELPSLASTALVVTEDGAQVHEQPNEDSPSLRTLTVTEIVRGKALRDGWWELTCGGFVAEDAVHEPGTGSASGADAAWAVGADSANVRAAPNTQAALVRKLNRGDSVVVKGVTDGWCQVDGGFVRADLLVPPAGGSAAPREPLDAAPGRAHRWSLVDLEGTSFTIEDISDTDLLTTVRKAMGATGLMETDWTYLGLTIGLPEDASFRFNFDAAYNSVVIVDQAGERYGSIVVQGPMEQLPIELRSLFEPLQVEPGEQADAILLFVPALKPSNIREVSMYISGRLQSFYPLD
jgi:uncharacterized protein YgiM (DUF1202 family)